VGELVEEHGNLLLADDEVEGTGNREQGTGIAGRVNED